MKQRETIFRKIFFQPLGVCKKIQKDPIKILYCSVKLSNRNTLWLDRVLNYYVFAWKHTCHDTIFTAWRVWCRRKWVERKRGSKHMYEPPKPTCILFNWISKLTCSLLRSVKRQVKHKSFFDLIASTLNSYWWQQINFQTYIASMTIPRAVQTYSLIRYCNNKYFHTCWVG